MQPFFRGHEYTTTSTPPLHTFLFTYETKASGAFLPCSLANIFPFDKTRLKNGSYIHGSRILVTRTRHPIGNARVAGGTCGCAAALPVCPIHDSRAHVCSEIPRSHVIKTGNAAGKIPVPRLSLSLPARIRPSFPPHAPQGQNTTPSREHRHRPSFVYSSPPSLFPTRASPPPSLSLACN